MYACTRDTHTTPQSCASARQHHRGRLRARRPLLRGAMSASLRPSSRAPQVVVEEWCLSALLHLRNIRRPSPGKHRRASPTTAASCWWAHMLAHNPPNSCVLPYGEAEFEQMHMPECWSQRTTAPAHARACVLRTVVLLRCRLVRPRVGSAKAQRCQHLSSTRRQIPRKWCFLLLANTHYTNRSVH